MLLATSRNYIDSSLPHDRSGSLTFVASHVDLNYVKGLCFLSEKLS